jgi:hypothetical protein
MSPDEIMNMGWDKVIVLKLHNGAKRTPLRLNKPKKALELDISPYAEPRAPHYAPPTLWEERGYYDTRTPSSSNAPSTIGTTGKGTGNGANKTVKDAQNALKNYPKNNPKKGRGHP